MDKDEAPSEPTDSVQNNSNARGVRGWFENRTVNSQGTITTEAPPPEGQPATEAEEVKIEQPKDLAIEKVFPVQEPVYEEPPDIHETIVNEEKKEVVYEIKPYYSHSVLSATFFVYFMWTFIYFIFRAGWTLNNNNWATYIYSILFLVVEFLSFIATALHYNNFTAITTNILVQKLPDILGKVKKDYPPIGCFICCYKEPHHIVARTFGYVAWSGDRASLLTLFAALQWTWTILPKGLLLVFLMIPATLGSHVDGYTFSQ